MRRRSTAASPRQAEAPLRRQKRADASRLDASRRLVDVAGDAPVWRAVGLVEHDAAPLGAERHLDGVIEDFDGLLGRDGAVDHAEDVGFFPDQEVLAGDLAFGARPFAERRAVARLDFDRDQLAAVIARARTDGDGSRRGRAADEIS